MPSWCNFVFDFIRNGIRGEESQIFNNKTPYFSKFIGFALVLGSEILSNGPMDTEWHPKTKVEALHLEKRGLKFETPPHEYRSLISGLKRKSLTSNLFVKRDTFRDLTKRNKKQRKLSINFLPQLLAIFLYLNNYSLTVFVGKRLKFCSWGSVSHLFWFRSRRLFWFETPPSKNSTTFLRHLPQNKFKAFPKFF